MDDKFRLRGQWRKSSYSNNGGDCVEIAVADDLNLMAHEGGGETIYLMRDSKVPDGPVLTLTPTGWDVFRAAIRNGAFEQPH
ncbi:DUF397 domain-containing protein [Sphaerisporangium sp. NPDC051011]|uniref:DUF397 domain-containing protein n=1 Tax=Sphaerisporangium sp. NPDC051011 TaxID=3155792 RepID=UPI0034107694